MAILNVTHDSFYAGSRALTLSDAVQKALQMQAAGADILDLGGESTRPGAPAVSEAEELSRVVPVLQALRHEIAIPISIDTSKPKVALAALEAGASWINDVTGFDHPDMAALAAEKQVDLVLMHMQGTPRTMQLHPSYPEGVVPHLMRWFAKKIERLTALGIHQQKIILDPGIGFGKTVAHNLEIIQNLKEFKKLGCRTLVGASRKSFLGKILNQPAENLLAATIAVNTVAIMAQTDIIRVHDVAEHRAAIDILSPYS